MATYTSIRSWTTSDVNPLTNPWGNAILPTVGDKVVIATTHIVTLDGTVNWWDDTSTGIIVNGTLKHSRSVNTKITARGDIVVWSNGTYDAGTEADPIPSTVTAEIELNDSAVMSADKWWFRTETISNTWAWVRLWWATKTRMTDFAVQAWATDTVITVTDATGWKTDDKLVIESTVAQASISGIVYRVITGIAGNVVTLSSSVVAIKPIWTKIMNLSSNVKVYGKTGNIYPSYFSIRHTSWFTSVDAIEIGETEFYCWGTTTDVMNQWVLSLTWQYIGTTTKSVKRIYRPIIHNIWSISGATVTKVNIWRWQLLNLFWNQAYRYTIEEPILSSENHYAMQWYSGTNTDIRDIKCIRANGIANTWYSQWPVGTTITWWYISCVANLIVWTGVIIGMSDMTINWVTNSGNQTAYGIYDQRNIIFWPMGDFTNSNSANFWNGANTPVLMDWCTFQATGSAVFTLTRGSTNINNTASWFSYTRRNINNDVTLQEKYTYGGKQERDNMTYSNSLSALRLDNWYSANPNVFVSSVSVGANETRRILGKCRYNTAYGTTYPTTLTVTGLGITPVVYTMPTTWADTWFPIDISVTNPNAYPWIFTLTFSGKSASNTESASVWFSWITIPDFVTVSRHYGFQFLNQPYQIENSFITEMVEATVSAYTGISIDHGTNTITLSSAHTIQEVYDYVYYNLTLNANLVEPEYFTTTDGVTFNTSYNIVNNNALTGSGTLITTGTYTGSGTYGNLTITDSTGVFTRITVSWFITNSRVQLYNTTTETELYNAVVASTSLSFPIKWTTDQTIRLRATYVSWLIAYLWYTSTNILTSSGVWFLVSQTSDTVYAANLIDGSTITEFSADYANIQIDLSDWDGYTSPQRGYAWFVYNLYSSLGIANYFGVLIAEDEVNYQNNTTVLGITLQNTTNTPAIFSGGNLYRSDGAPIIVPWPSAWSSIQMFYGRAYIANSDSIQKKLTTIVGEVL